MIESKSALLAAWLCMLVFGCGLPFLLTISGAATARPVRMAPALLRWSLLAIAAALLGLRGVSGFAAPIVLSLAFVLLMLGPEIDIALGALAAASMMSTVVWWNPAMVLALPTAIAFLLAGGCATMLTRLPFAKKGGWPATGTFALLFAIAALATLPLGLLGEPIVFRTTWHHWGAYVAPVQAMFGGGVPFRDYPVQYGMGPTLLIAALSGGDPWVGMWRTATLVNSLYLPVIGVCASLVLREAPRALRLLALAAITIAVLLWTGYPPDEQGAMTMPSAGGLRFLPLALLMLSIMTSEASHRSGAIAGYALWLFGMAWSPEAGVYATIVWFPYLGVRAAQARNANTPRDVILAALRGAGVAAAAITAGVVLLALLFRAAFGEWPSAYGFLTYIFNPPGILPANPFGPIWLTLAVAAIGCVGLIGADPRVLRTGMVCILGFTAVLSYYLLGRSHDNNLLNLFPFMALLAAWTLSARQSPMAVGFIQFVLVGIVAWPATFGWSSWTGAANSGQALTIGPTRFLDHVRFASPDAWAASDAWLALTNGPFAPSADAGAAIAWIAERGGEMPVVINRTMIMPRYSAGPEWTGVNNLANYDLLPREVIAHFIRNSAKNYHRPGWLLVDRTMRGDWLTLFSSAYDISGERVFGGYTAYRLTPKQAL